MPPIGFTVDSDLSLAYCSGVGSEPGFPAGCWYSCRDRRTLASAEVRARRLGGLGSWRMM
jgi:hypothetical protein